MKGIGDCLSQKKIQAAAAYLKNLVHHTPIRTSTTLDQSVGMNVYLKMENEQKTGAFKARGACFKIGCMNDEAAKRGVIAASAGNHAQGVALAAAKRGIQAKIFMPIHTPKPKVEATKSYGAAVELAGENFQEALFAAQKEQQQTGSTFIHPFDDIDIIAGQGTIAIEMLTDQPQLDTLIVPIGGGGLISGIAFAAKQIKPSIRIIGVQTEAACATYHTFHKHLLPSLTCKTIAEGIAVKEPGKVTMPLIQQYVDDVVTISEHDIAASILQLLERHKTLAEGAGAAAFAALMRHHQSIHSKHCGIIISGGNFDLQKLSELHTHTMHLPANSMA
ncbi:threonine/serine dehydratase [Terribacillus halophilus]|uniref:threonine/serine dehydratase n=1 Tax=Terribacillus halophilus TaxID=361279 RepID=UPI0021198C07|nr:threonine/serine dehydratase [Terribacillus halophilus]